MIIKNYVQKNKIRKTLRHRKSWKTKKNIGKRITTKASVPWAAVVAVVKLERHPGQQPPALPLWQGANTAAGAALTDYMAAGAAPYESWLPRAQNSLSTPLSGNKD